VGWMTFFTLALLRFRKRRNPVPDYKGVTSHRNTYLEVGVVVVEAVLLIGFSIPLWADRVDEFPAEKDATVVRVIAQQFAWNVHYPGPDGKFGKTDVTLVDEASNPIGLDRSDPVAKDDVTTVNQLHVPVNKPVIVQLSSKDVIHSFGVPEFRVKQDAIPGLRIPLWWTPTVTTEEMRKKAGHAEDWTYEIACAQLCGIGHATMRGFVTVETPEAFQAWFDGQAAAQATSEEDDIWN
jgi:cytochrome c oxidase subunit 2